MNCQTKQTALHDKNKTYQKIYIRLDFITNTEHKSNPVQNVCEGGEMKHDFKKVEFFMYAQTQHRPT